MTCIKSHNSIANKIMILLFSIIYILELNWLLIDSISGFFQLNSIHFFGSLNISGIVRSTFFVVGSIVIIMEFSKNIMSSILLLFSLLLFFSLLVLGHFIFYDVDNLLKDAYGSLRLFSLFLLFIIVKIQIKNHYRLLKILITFEILNFYNYEIFTH